MEREKYVRVKNKSNGQVFTVALSDWKCLSKGSKDLIQTEDSITYALPPVVEKKEEKKEEKKDPKKGAGKE